jgi:nucleotide-binding universal stress UspA family protein
MKKILCPTDYSPVAKNAAHFAANVAKTINAEITLFHVQSKFDEASEQYVKSRGGIIDTASDYLVTLSQQISKAYGVICNTEVETLTVALKKAIAERAAGYDLIVMGTNGPHDLVQYFTGSNSYNAAVNSDVPVLIIPPDVAYKPIKNVLFAIDYVNQPKVPMAQLLPFVTANEGEITLLQVLENNIDPGMKKRLEDLQYTIKSDFENAARLRFVNVSGENIADSIDEYTRKHNVDLLALCTVERNGLSNLFHDSVIKKISAEAAYPLFVFNH